MLEWHASISGLCNTRVGTATCGSNSTSIACDRPRRLKNITSNAVGVTLFADVGKPVQRVATAGGDSSSGSVSPDGRWLLYTLSVSGRNDVFVRTLPIEAGGSAAAGRWQVSSSGGGQPT